MLLLLPFAGRMLLPEAANSLLGGLITEAASQQKAAQTALEIRIT